MLAEANVSGATRYAIENAYSTASGDASGFSVGTWDGERAQADNAQELRPAPVTRLAMELIHVN